MHRPLGGFLPANITKVHVIDAVLLKNVRQPRRKRINRNFTRQKRHRLSETLDRDDLKFKSGSILDSIWVARDLTAFETTVTIIDRNGPITASTSETFSDSDEDTDHRPLLVNIIGTDVDERIESLREDIALLEETLERMRETLVALEAAQE